MDSSQIPIEKLDVSSENSKPYFSHKRHFFIITTAGKPVFTQ